MEGVFPQIVLMIRWANADSPIWNYCSLLTNHRCSRSQNEFFFPMTFLVPFDYRFTRNSRTNQVKHHFCYSSRLKEMKEISQLLSISNTICLSFQWRYIDWRKDIKAYKEEKHRISSRKTIWKSPTHNPYQPGRSFQGEVWGEEKSHIRIDRAHLPPSPFRSRQTGTFNGKTTSETHTIGTCLAPHLYCLLPYSNQCIFKLREHLLKYFAQSHVTDQFHWEKNRDENREQEFDFVDYFVCSKQSEKNKKMKSCTLSISWNSNENLKHSEETKLNKISEHKRHWWEINFSQC